MLVCLTFNSDILDRDVKEGVVDVLVAIGARWSQVGLINPTTLSHQRIRGEDRRLFSNLNYASAEARHRTHCWTLVISVVSVFFLLAATPYFGGATRGSLTTGFIILDGSSPNSCSRMSMDLGQTRLYLLLLRFLRS